MLLKVQLDYLVHQLQAVLVSQVRTILQREMKPMVDVVADLTAQVNATLASINSIVSTVQSDVGKLIAAQSSNNSAAIEDLIGKLKTGTDAAVAAVTAAQSSLNTASPPGDSPSPAPEGAPAPDAAQPTPPPAAPAS